MPKDGLIALSNSVRRTLDLDGTSGIVVEKVGWPERWRQRPTHSRIVFLPGKFDGTDPPKTLAGGRFEAPWHTHTLDEGPNEILGAQHLATVSVWAVDATSDATIRDSEAQREQTEALFEFVVQAMHVATDIDTGAPIGDANIRWLDFFWNVPPFERSFGLEKLATFELGGPYYVKPHAVGRPTLVLARSFGPIAPPST